MFENYLLESPQSVMREFKRTKIDAVFRNYENLLKRVYTIEEKAKLIENLSLRLSLRCFNAPFLEQRIQGLKGIIDACKEARMSRNR